MLVENPSDALDLPILPSLRVYDVHGVADEMPVEPPGAQIILLSDPKIVLETEHDLQPILDRLGDLYPNEPIHEMALVAAGGFHHIFAIRLSGGKVLIARVAKVNGPRSSLSKVTSKMRGECATLSVLRNLAPAVPVPRVFHVEAGVVQEDLIRGPWMLMEHVRGAELTRVYGGLTTQQKIILTCSLAKAMGSIFEVTNQVSGSVLDITSEGEPTIGPVVALANDRIPIIPAGRYSSNDLVSIYLYRMRTVCYPEARQALEALDRVRAAVCPVEPPTTYHLTHTDMRMPNVFVTSIPTLSISGILDWELHAFLPATLAADYPYWLRYDGYYDPQYNPTNSQLNLWWEETPTVARELRKAFQEAVRVSHPKFYEALVSGVAQREIFYWFHYWEDSTAYYDAVIAWAAQYTSS